MTEEERESEFGRGLVFCIQQFSEHLENEWSAYIYNLAGYKSEFVEGEGIVFKNPQNVDKTVREHVTTINIFAHTRRTYERTLSHIIELWASGASDHFYEMKTPVMWEEHPTEMTTLIIKEVQELREMALQMGHGFRVDKLWTFEDFKKLRDLTMSISLRIDKLLTIYDAQRGQW